MAWKHLTTDRLRCPHCRELIDVKIESKTKVVVREPFRFAEGAPEPKRKGE